MKGLYSEIIKEQNFGFQSDFEDKVQKKQLLFNDRSKLIIDKVKMYVYRVNYSYKTKRSNKKTSYKLVVLNNNDETEAKFKFLDYIKEFNSKFPYRELSNVKILDIQHEEIVIPL